MSSGYTGEELVGSVHPEQWTLECTCGGFIDVTLDGDLIGHSEPVNYREEHIVIPHWTKSIWRYEIVE